MSDVEFTVRIMNQVTAPAKAIQQSMKGISKSFTDTQKILAAPAPKRGPLSDWQKMVSKANTSQVKDFAAQQAKLVRVQQKAAVQATKPAGAGLSKLFGAIGLGGGKGGGLVGMIGMAGPEGAAIAAVITAVNKVAETVLDAGAAVVSLGLEFVETALEAGKFAESSTKAIGYLTDNAAHAGVVFDDVRHLAQGLGLDVETTVEGFQKLLAAQFTVGQSKGLIKMGADMRAIGASAEEVQRIIYAMSEIKSMGTLQKRQERMLQMAGISGELIDQALMKRTGIKSKGGLDLARKKGMIDSNTAILAVQDAVMAKTHEKALGDTGAARANGTIAGMQDKFKAGLENFWIDVGQAMLPGATRVMKLVADTIGKVMDDPKVAELGAFMLAKWEVFTVWIQAKWPMVENLLIGGFHIVADAIMWVTDALNISQGTWQAIKGTVELCALAFVSVASSLLVALSPLLSVIAIVGVVLYTLARLTGWLVDLAVSWYNSGKEMVGKLIDGIMSMIRPLAAAMGIVIATTSPDIPVPGGNMNPLAAATAGTRSKPLILAPDPEALAAGNTSAISSSLSGISSKTEAAHPTGAPALNVVNHINVPQSDDPQRQGALIGAAVRSEMEKAFKSLG